jgi:hypothetical protein
VSVDRSSAGFEFWCDRCGVARPPGKLGRGSFKREFIEEWQDAKDEGWRARRGADEKWQHLCPDCA